MFIIIEVNVYGFNFVGGIRYFLIFFFLIKEKEIIMKEKE